MATSKFTVIFKSKETKNVLTYEMNFETTYKTAIAIAKESCSRDGDDLIAVVESKKIFPNGISENIEKIGERAYRL